MTQHGRGPADVARIVAAAISDQLREHVTPPPGAADVQSALGADLVTEDDHFRVAAFHAERNQAVPLALVVLVLERVPSEAELSGRLIERYGLTPREAAVARLLAHRHSTAEIARALGISVHTARHHTESVLAKLGV